VRQAGLLQETYRDARSTEHDISTGFVWLGIRCIDRL